MSTDELRQSLRAAREEIAKVIIGQDHVIELALVTIFTGNHALVEGVPGVAKTLLVRTLGKVLGCDTQRIQFTPDLMPSDIIGTNVYNMKESSFSLIRGPVFTAFLLADEINRAPAKTQAALLEVMQENQVTIEGKSAQLKPPFMAVATQNPVEHEGTYPLPEAQLDRFLFKVLIDYPDHEAEKKIVSAVTAERVGDSLYVDDVTTVMSCDDVIAAQQLVARTRIDDVVLDYAVRIVRQTRQASGIRMGAGPRGAISIVRASRACAVLQGRNFVTPDDVRKVAVPALRHRIALAPELEIEAYRPDDILRDILESVDAPRT